MSEQPIPDEVIEAATTYEGTNLNIERTDSTVEVNGPKDEIATKLLNLALQASTGKAEYGRLQGKFKAARKKEIDNIPITDLRGPFTNTVEIAGVVAGNRYEVNISLGLGDNDAFARIFNNEDGVSISGGGEGAEFPLDEIAEELTNNTSETDLRIIQTETGLALEVPKEE